MAKYQKKEGTGNEYVLLTKSCISYIKHLLMKTPAHWYRYLTRQPVKIGDEIYTLVAQANRVYINTSASSEEQIEAYKERDALLQDALRLFAALDAQMDLIYDQLDLSVEEYRRVKHVVGKYLDELKENIKPGDTVGIKIKADLSGGFSIETGQGVKIVHIPITAKHREELTKREAAAKAAISDRLTKDRTIIKRLQEKMDKAGSPEGSFEKSGVGT